MYQFFPLECNKLKNQRLSGEPMCCSQFVSIANAYTALVFFTFSLFTDRPSEAGERVHTKRKQNIYSPINWFIYLAFNYNRPSGKTKAEKMYRVFRSIARLGKWNWIDSVGIFTQFKLKIVTITRTATNWWAIKIEGNATNWLMCPSDRVHHKFENEKYTHLFRHYRKNWI